MLNSPLSHEINVFSHLCISTIRENLGPISWFVRGSVPHTFRMSQNQGSSASFLSATTKFHLLSFGLMDCLLGLFLLRSVVRQPERRNFLMVDRQDKKTGFSCSLSSA